MIRREGEIRLDERDACPGGGEDSSPSPSHGALPEHLLGVSRGGLGSSARTALSARSHPGYSRLAGGHGELGV